MSRPRKRQRTGDLYATSTRSSRGTVRSFAAFVLTKSQRDELGTGPRCDVDGTSIGRELGEPGDRAAVDQWHLGPVRGSYPNLKAQTSRVIRVLERVAHREIGERFGDSVRDLRALGRRKNLDPPLAEGVAVP